MKDQTKNNAGTFTHRQIVNAWCMYDWANSAFATTIMAAVLPVYYSQVAAATLASEATATAYWSLGLSLSLLIVALLSPILGTISDVVRSKKRFLTLFAGLGVIATSMLILVDRGDWLLASILFVLARIGFTGANVFYDALLPHVAQGEEQDRVSARGFAMGYLGGGILLAANTAMIVALPDSTWGPRLSFLSVALWWAIFSIPILRRVPEPPAATAQIELGESVFAISLRRITGVFKDIRHYKELFKFLLAFLIYNDAIGTIIGVATIYGAELGFDSVELILALLLVQFVGIPFSLIFGRLPSKAEPRRPFFLAFVLFNLVTLPTAGIVSARALPNSGVGTILALLIGIQVFGAIFALLTGRRLFGKLAASLDTRRAIILALIIYAVIAVWGFVLTSAIEFWLLAWMVAVVQGGSQALSRSLYASLSPKAKSGEFFGLFGVMEKFSAILGPLVFASAVGIFGNSRPAILSLILFFIIGIIMLRNVDIEEGKRIAREEDARVGLA